MLEQYSTRELLEEAEHRINASEAEPVENVSLVSMDTIAEEETRWLYQPYVPRGKITLCAAYPGTGKTFLLCYMAACVSSGRSFFNIVPFETEPEKVIFLSTEDGLADTLKKRFRVCGANMKNILAPPEEERFTFDDPRIELMIKEYRPALMIFDPFQSFIGENVELNMANKTRPKLDHIAKLAKAYDVAIVIICHFNKNQKGDAITRIIGSTDIVGVSRSYLALGKVPGEVGAIFMSHEKSSLDKKGNTILFEIDPDNGGIKYLGESDMSMDDYIKSAESRNRSAPALAEAKEFIKLQMPGGEIEASKITKLAAANGIKYDTLNRARLELGIESKRKVFGGPWFWIMPRQTS